MVISALHPRHPRRHGGPRNLNRPLPEGLQLLKGSLVRRVPTEAELARRTSIALNERDQDLLVAVHQHGFLTAELIVLACYPPGPVGRRSPCSSAYERLRQLWLWHFVDRIELPVARGLGGRHPYLYTLGTQGVPHVAAALGGEATVRRRRLDRLDDQFLDHDLYAAWLWANLRALLRHAPVRGWAWMAEKDMRARRLGIEDPQNGRRRPFLPDGYFEIAYGPSGASAAPRSDPPGRDGGHERHERYEDALSVEAAPDRGRWPSASSRLSGVGLGQVDLGDVGAEAAGGDMQCCVVEIDSGHLSLTRFRNKLRGFELALERGLFAREWRRPTFDVVVLTNSDERLEHLIQTARCVVSRERWGDYSLGTFDVLDPSRFATYDWLTLERERASLLFEDAYANPYAGATGETDETDRAGPA